MTVEERSVALLEKLKLDAVRERFFREEKTLDDINEEECYCFDRDEAASLSMDGLGGNCQGLLDG